MKFPVIVPIMLVALLVLASYPSAAYVQINAVNGPFVTDSNILLIAKVYDNNGGAKNNVDLNTYAVNLATGEATNLRYDGSVQGILFRGDINFSAAGDYNIVAIDLNDSVSSTVSIKVRPLSGITTSFNSHNPPFNINSGEDINFTLQGKNGASVDTNAILRIKLVSDANNSQASPTVDINANGFDQNAIDTSSLSQGLYYIDVNNGLALIPITVFKFKAFLNLQDDLNNTTTLFGQGKTVTIIGRATNFDGNDNYTISSAVVTVTTPAGSTSTLATCTTGSQLKCTYSIAPDASAGDYTVNAGITVGSDSINVRRGFTVQAYSMNFFAKEFTGGKAGKEKMPSVYPTNSDVNFEVHFTETSSGLEMSGDVNMNNRFCQDQNISVFIQKVGDKDVNSIPDINYYREANPNYCNIKIIAPSVQGTYTVAAVANVGAQTLRKSTVLNVQNFMIFSMPVAPDTYDPNTPSGKFTFYKGESVGLNPSYVDLNGILSPKIVRVRQIKVFESSGVRTFSGTDVNWNSDKNIMTLSASAVNTLAGGFKPVEAVVDVNMVNVPDANSVTAFGMFKLNVMNLSAQLVSTTDSNATRKSESFGPASVGLDENIHVKVTALSGTAGISGAAVSLQSMRNMDTWEEVDTSGVASKVTDANGNATLTIGRLQDLGLGSGGYMVEAKVTTTDGNEDTAETFFEARRFVVFLQPLDTRTGTQCQFAQNFRKGGDMNFVIRAFNPRLGFGAGDVNVSITRSISPLKVLYFGSPSKPQFPPIEVPDVNFDVNSSYPCMSMGGGPVAPSTTDLAEISIYKTTGQWQAGFYNISLQVDANGGTLDGNREIGRGFMQLQSFMFNVSPAQISQYGAPTGKPGGAFDLNVTLAGATGSATVSAKLIDPNGGERFEMAESGENTTDLNLGYANSDVNGYRAESYNSPDDCNATYCPSKSITMNSLNAAQVIARDQNVLSVMIPSSAKQQDYMIELTATDSAGASATGDVFLQIKTFKLINFGWWDTMYGVWGMNDNAELDWNATDVASGQAYYRYQPQMGADGGSMPTIDLNFMVNYTSRALIVDINGDRNFMTPNMDQNITPGAFLSNRVATTDANKFIITDISRVGAQEPGIKFIRRSALDANSSNFGYIGAYPADTNFTIPVLVKDASGLPMDANVTVTNIAIYNPGSFFPTYMSSRSCSGLAELIYCNLSAADFNSVYDQTDANGLAVVNMRVGKPGSRLMLEMTVWRTTDEGTALGTTQKLQPFEGPTIDVKKYTVTTLVTGPRVRMDYNSTLRSSVSDLNIFDMLTSAAVDASRLDAYIGVYYGAVGDRNGLLGDINADMNWYFVRVDANTLWVDDDKNIAINPSAAEQGAFRSFACTDFNSQCAITYAAGSDTRMYWNRDTNSDTNAMDSNITFYPVYSDPFNPQNAPNRDANVQVAVTLTNLSGVSLSDVYNISNVRLENYAQWTTQALSPASYSNKAGTTLISIGKLSDTNKSAGQYSLVFRLRVGSGAETEERAFLNVKN